MWLLDSLQNIIIHTGLLVGCLLCAKRILIDRVMTVGDFGNLLLISAVPFLLDATLWASKLFWRLLQVDPKEFRGHGKNDGTFQ